MILILLVLFFVILHLPFQIALLSNILFHLFQVLQHRLGLALGLQRWVNFLSALWLGSVNFYFRWLKICFRTNVGFYLLTSSTVSNFMIYMLCSIHVLNNLFYVLYAIAEINKAKNSSWPTLVAVVSLFQATKSWRLLSCSESIYVFKCWGASSLFFSFCCEVDWSWKFFTVSCTASSVPSVL